MCTMQKSCRKKCKDKNKCLFHLDIIYNSYSRGLWEKKKSVTGVTWKTSPFVFQPLSWWFYLLQLTKLSTSLLHSFSLLQSKRQESPQNFWRWYDPELQMNWVGYNRRCVEKVRAFRSAFLPLLYSMFDRPLCRLCCLSTISDSGLPCFIPKHGRPDGL